MPAAPSITKDSKRRISFIDTVRGIAVLLMVAVHSTDVFLAMPYREGWLWSQIDILFGFVAPAFILLSGITFYIALRRRRESGGSVRDLIGRALMIAALGFWLHIPSHSLPRALDATPDQAFGFFDSDILQVIGLLMLLTLALAALLRDLRRTASVVLGLGMIIAAVSPLIRNAGFVDGLPLMLRLYLVSPGSFPLFPYAAYFLVGFGGAVFLLDAQEKSFGPPRVAAAGGGLLIASYLLQFLLSWAPPFDDFWQGSPALFLFRLGGIVLVIGAVQWLGTFGRSRWLEGVGQGSLGIYLLHLMLLYGSPVTMGMQHWFNGLIYRAQTPLSTFLLFSAIAVLAWSAVDGWRRFRQAYPVWGVRLVWGWWIGFGLIFLLTGW